MGSPGLTSGGGSVVSAAPDVTVQRDLEVRAGPLG